MEKVRNPTDLAAINAEREEQRKTEAIAQQTELNDMRQIMATDYGRRFMWNLLAKAGVYRTSFTGNSTTFFNEGQRNIGLMMQSQILQACPEQYIVMLNESKEQQEQKQ